MTPLGIDLFCGLGGWTEGLLAEGYYVVGFDIDRHDYGTGGYPAQLVLQDVLTLHGRQFKDAALIVASPPCQEFSYMVMPWSRAKAKRAAIVEGTKNNGGPWFNIGSPGQKVTGRNPVNRHISKAWRDKHYGDTDKAALHLTNQAESDGVKQHKSGRAWFADPDSISGSTASHSTARKAASAAIAKIPFALARHIAAVWKPRAKAVA